MLQHREIPICNHRSFVVLRKNPEFSWVGNTLCRFESEPESFVDWRVVKSFGVSSWAGNLDENSDENCVADTLDDRGVSKKLDSHSLEGNCWPDSSL